MTEDKDGRQMTAGLVHASLDEALRWVGSELPTGSLRVQGPCPGSVFFEHGRLYFATVDGQPMSGAELAGAGIDRAVWQQASTGSDARLNFVAELLAAGCDESAIERFVLHRLETAIDSMGLDSGPVEVGRGRHGFGAGVSFSPDQLSCLQRQTTRSEVLDDDTLVSLASVSSTASVSLDGRTWNALAQLFSPARYEELHQRLGEETAAMLTTALTARGLVDLVESNRPDDPWNRPSATTAEESTPPQPPRPASFVVQPEPPSQGDLGDQDDEDDEYVPDKVGRQAYAAIASMRASAADPPAPEKARALRRLIEAVKGL